LWFHFYTPRAEANYRNGPINKFGERTQTFTNLSEAVREFHLVYGDYFTRLKLVKSYHIGETYGGFPLFKEGDSDVILKAEDVRNHNPLILSFFKDDEGNDYFAVVCNSRTDIARVNLTISSKAGKIVCLADNSVVTPTIVTQALAAGGVTETANEDKIPDSYEYGSWYAPGQLNLYKIEKQ
jgi:hypothetical protein